MSTKTIMRSLRINEIASCDKPAMKGATVVFIKRTPEEESQKSATVGKSADGTPREEPMADNDVTVIKTENEALKKSLATATANLARVTALASLSDAERAYMKGLGEKDAEGFLLSESSARAAVLKAAGESNPVVFTSAGGETFRKNDDARMIALAKRFDDQSAVLAKADALHRQSIFEKRAVEELPNLPGDVATRATLLKAVDALPDAAQREAVMTTLRAQNTAMAKAFETRGTTAGGAPGSAEERLDVMAKRIEVEQKVSKAKAYDLALSSAEGAALYGEYAKTLTER